MVEIVLLAMACGIAAKLAQAEDRSPWLWAGGALLVAFGIWWFTAYGAWVAAAVALVLTYAGLFAVRWREESRREREARGDDDPRRPR